ncbi:IS66 family insertion sequence element accessory protein TnpB [Rhizobium lentis]|nr:IS66 family insertion sequence element accessory protein TnpB [Rhizobium lentis]MBX5014486.1 IS66 family insertion sequence element accessory protein TnpB [Rhizobium lentis]MBX5020838.1 IS66 family insertion sequence element accessory protein TnpB [Rhizobium lentis]MBX5087388.1 IS66 family insertion sequence element accessory protein TnpB [Rhizobium lentis]MBX5100113.1 IS66 family insertion sequence element accessory protein TnpB [Rhizobium lentis]MBX5124812.1 IS66 family insertion sequence
MIGPGTGVRVYLACGITDMRKGVEGLAALAQNVLRQKPTGGAVFAFRGKRGDRLKLLYFDGQGFCLYYNDLHSYCISLSGSVEGFGVSCIFLLGDDAIDELVPSTALLLR